MNLHDYDLVIINSSAGKDSLVAKYEIACLAKAQGYSSDRIVVSHQDLGESEWPGTKELVEKQASLFGFEVVYSKRRDQTGYEETLLEYVERRGKWPDRSRRYCTSDFKRGPGSRVVTKLSPSAAGQTVLYVFGFRADESPARAKYKEFEVNKRLTTKKRLVHDYLPVFRWDSAKVWEVIKSNALPYHYAYDLGMPRLSCVFCIFSPKDALVIAAKANPELFEKYVATEKKIGHKFKNDLALSEIQEAINSDYQPKNIPDWVM